MDESAMFYALSRTVHREAIPVKLYYNKMTNTVKTTTVVAHFLSVMVSNLFTRVLLCQNDSCVIWLELCLWLLKTMRSMKCQAWSKLSRRISVNVPDEENFQIVLK